MTRIVSINNIQKYKPIEKKSMNKDKFIIDIIQYLRNESIRRVPEYGDFSPLKTSFINKNKDLNIKNVELLIKHSILGNERPKERELEIIVKSANEQNKHSFVLKRGEKEEILNYLKSDELPLRIDSFIKESSEKFSEIENY